MARHPANRLGSAEANSADLVPSAGGRPKFARFEAELRELCLRFGVAMAPAAEGRIGVWDADEGDEPVRRLVDRTAEGEEARLCCEGEPVPGSFLTVLAATAHPRYIGWRESRENAQSLAARHYRADLVPIGSTRRVRGWAVVEAAGEG